MNIVVLGYKPGQYWTQDLYISKLRELNCNLYITQAKFHALNHKNYLRLIAADHGDITDSALKTTLIIVFKQSGPSEINSWISWNKFDKKKLPPVFEIDRYFIDQNSPAEFLEIIEEQLQSAKPARRKLKVTQFAPPDAPNLQESTKRVLQHLKNYGPIDALTLWNWTIGQNLCWDFLFSDESESHGHLYLSGPGFYDYLHQWSEQGRIRLENQPNEPELVHYLKD